MNYLLQVHLPERAYGRLAVLVLFLSFHLFRAAHIEGGRVCYRRSSGRYKEADTGPPRPAMARPCRRAQGRAFAVPYVAQMKVGDSSSGRLWPGTAWSRLEPPGAGGWTAGAACLSHHKKDPPPEPCGSDKVHTLF